MITRDRLMELLEYDPQSGVFTWNVRRGGTASAGSVAGFVRNDGYCEIKIDGQIFLSHRLAWLYVHGELPEKKIDHINEIKGDNRIENLREATHSENQWNISAARSDSRSKMRGVRLWCGKRWMARIKVRGKNINLGYFDNPEDARAAYLAAKQVHHPLSVPQIQETK